MSCSALQSTFPPRTTSHSSTTIFTVHLTLFADHIHTTPLTPSPTRYRFGAQVSDNIRRDVINPYLLTLLIWRLTWLAYILLAPSQPSAPPSHQTLPVYPFQCICSDFFTYKGIVSVDSYSNWPIVERSTGGAQGLIASLRQIFGTFGIAEELLSDGGPEFSSAVTQTFLRSMGVQHRLSSVAYPHSNCRAEIGVKTVKHHIAQPQVSAATQAQAVSSTLTNSIGLFYNIETRPTRTPSSRQLRAYSDILSVTSFPSFQDVTYPTQRGARR